MGKFFLDINECEEISDACKGGLCLNLPGTFLCECPEGLLLSSDGQSCQGLFFLPDIYYGSICTAFFWSSICDGFSFVDIDECGDSSSLCSNGVCENYLGGYQCRCLDGYGPNPQHTSCLGRHNTATCVKFMMRYDYLLHSCIYSSWKGCTTWYCHC